MTDYSKIP